MQEQHLALIFATKMDEGMQIDPVPTTPPIPTFLSTTLQTQNLHSRPHSTGLKMIMMATGLAMAPRPCL